MTPGQSDDPLQRIANTGGVKCSFCAIILLIFAVGSIAVVYEVGLKSSSSPSQQQSSPPSGSYQDDRPYDLPAYDDARGYGMKDGKYCFKDPAKPGQLTCNPLPKY